MSNLNFRKVLLLVRYAQNTEGAYSEITAMVPGHWSNELALKWFRKENHFYEIKIDEGHYDR